LSSGSFSIAAAVQPCRIFIKSRLCSVHRDHEILGIPRMISLDNFRTPNFELVADCLQWLVQRQVKTPCPMTHFLHCIESFCALLLLLSSTIMHHDPITSMIVLSVDGDDYVYHNLMTVLVLRFSPECSISDDIALRMIG